MSTAVLAARLLVAGIFAVAGLAKLADRSGSRQAIIDFGLPFSVAGPLGILLPAAELAVAIALIPSSTTLWGSVAALALLALFLAGIGVNLARGRKPDCHCFGQLHSAPAGWKTLLRNGVLAAVAVFVLWRGWEGDTGPSVVAWLGALSTAELVGLVAGLVMLVLLAAQWWFLVHLLGQNGRLLVRLEALESKLAPDSEVPAPSRNGAGGLPVGAPAPAFGLSGLYGETLTLDSLRAPGKPVVLVFADPGCGPCNALLPEIGRWQREHADKLAISLVSRGSVEENRTKSSEHGLTGVLVQEDREVFEAYEAYGTPSAVVVRPDGTVGSPLATGSEAIGDLVKQAVEEAPRVPLLPRAPAPADNDNGGGPCPKCGKAHPDGEGERQALPAAKKIGEPAPEVKMADLSGEGVDLADFRGARTLVLFWNPGCGFCQRMLPDLKEWEANRPEGAPKLLVVSAGAREANEAMGLGSPTVLDQEFAVGRAFGAGGTPSAVLVDAEGKVASEVAVGAPAVLELAGAGAAKAGSKG